MAISYVGGTNNTSIDGADTSLDLTAISGLAQNDLVIVAYAIGSNTDYDMAMVTSGYTEIADIHAADTRQSNLGVFYKKMGASVDTAAVVDGDGQSGHATPAVAIAFRGVDQTTPLDVTPTENSVANSADVNPASIDPVTAGAWVVIALGGSLATDSGAGATTPTGYATNAKVQVGSDVIDGIVGLAYNSSPSDPEDPGAWVVAGDNLGDSACAATIALRPGAEASNGSGTLDLAKVLVSGAGDVIVSGSGALTLSAIAAAGLGFDPSVTAPSWIVEVAFTTDPGSETPVWTNIKPWVESFDFDRGTNHELDQPQTATGKAVLNNEDRRFDPTYASGPYFGYILPMRRIRFRAVFRGVTYDECYGYIESWPQEYPEDGALQRVTITFSDGFLPLALADAEGTYSQEASGTRVTNILDAAGWPDADRDVDAGQATVVASTLGPDDKALSHLLDVHAAELGLMYMSRSGKFTFVDRGSFITEPTDFTTPWGDVTGEHRYVDVELPFDHDNIWNDIRVTAEGGAEQQATDATSKTRFFRRTLTRSVILASDNEAADQAWYLLSRFKDPELRVSRMELAVMRDPDQVAQVLAGEIGNKHRARRRHPATPSDPIEVDVYIVGIHMWADAKSGEWGADWRMAPLASESAWVLDDEDLSVLDSTTRLAY